MEEKSTFRLYQDHGCWVPVLRQQVSWVVPCLYVGLDLWVALLKVLYFCFPLVLFRVEIMSAQHVSFALIYLKEK